MSDKLEISDQKQVKVNLDFDDFDDVDLLSAEEKAALESDIDEGEGHQGAGEDDDGADAAKQAADETAAKKTADEADAKQTADEAVAADVAKKEAEEAAAEKAAEDEVAKKAEQAAANKEETPATIVPGMAPPLTMQGLSEQEVAEVKKGLEDASKKFKEGEIDYEEYLDARDALKEKLWTHNLATQVSEQSVEKRWKWEQESFLSSQENEWINGDDVVFSAFAATVNRIMSTDEGSVMPGADLLAQAREEVAARFSPTQPAERADRQEEKKKQEALKAAKDREAGKQPPETLGGKPTAEIDEGVGEFDWLDKLDGEAYEKSVTGLSEVQLKRYEASI